MKQKKLRKEQFLLQFITHANDRYNELTQAEEALRGGCRWVQLRMKNASDEEVLSVGKRLRDLTREYDACMIVDDRVRIAQQLHADGVHLGKNDMPIDVARQILGPDYIIGGTANTIEDIKRIYMQGADYIGCGPFRFTTTKERLAPLLGLEGYKNLVEDMHRQQIYLPMVAIGGIVCDDIPAIMQTGVEGVAISGAIAHADSPLEATRQILDVLKTY